MPFRILSWQFGLSQNIALQFSPTARNSTFPMICICGLFNFIFLQSSSSTKWRVIWTVNQTCTNHLMICVSPWYHLHSWLDARNIKNLPFAPQIFYSTLSCTLYLWAWCDVHDWLYPRLNINSLTYLTHSLTDSLSLSLLTKDSTQNIILPLFSVVLLGCVEGLPIPLPSWYFLRLTFHLGCPY